MEFLSSDLKLCKSASHFKRCLKSRLLSNFCNSTWLVDLHYLQYFQINYMLLLYFVLYSLIQFYSFILIKYFLLYILLTSY